MSEQTRVKGLAFRSVFASLGKLRGEAVSRAALEAMSAPLREGFAYGSIVAGGWYPIALYRELWSVARRVTGEGVGLVDEVAREATRGDLNGAYRTIANLIAPQTLFKLSQRLFSSYYSQGRVEVLESRCGFTHVRWTDCLGFDQNLWTEVLATSIEVLAAGGAKHIRVHVVSGGGDATALEASAHWSGGGNASPSRQR